ncbi:hypothetical protein Tsubulata_045698 [Turnera subulata]|uniref:Uncharacterized protein n=1 Tax=Turnera subulata TaxID=218843 RepID=A0A9Q0FT12_9ROSI|nr:hypothetical protein Tsubulata_045698 [Turnera subulata]
MRTDLDFAWDDDDATAASEVETISVPDKDKSGRLSRVTFKILLSYHGPSFDGWQKQPGLNTVQGKLNCSNRKINHWRAVLLLWAALTKEFLLFSKKDVIPGDIEDAINNVAPGNSGLCEDECCALYT